MVSPLIFIVLATVMILPTWCSDMELMFGNFVPNQRQFAVQYETLISENGTPTNLSVTFKYCGTGIERITLIGLKIVAKESIPMIIPQSKSLPVPIVVKTPQQQLVKQVKFTPASEMVVNPILMKVSALMQ